MARVELIEAVRSVMSRAGFAVSERCDLRPVSFDLVARRDDDLVILKVLTNVDALSEPVAQEIKLLCKFLEGRPVLVGLRAGTGTLEEGVVYCRHDIPIVTPGTLAEYVLGGEAPMVFAAPGGFYVHLDAQALRTARVEHGMSLGAMASIAGVSRRAIQMYEEGMSASIDAAMRLEEHLGVDLVRPTDPFAAFDASRFRETPPTEGEQDPMERLLTGLLRGLGYEVRATKRSPFHALSTQEEQTFLTGVGELNPALERRARIVRSVSRVTERPGFFVVQRTTRTEVRGVPVLGRDELQRMRDPESILDLIIERTRRDAEHPDERS